MIGAHCTDSTDSTGGRPYGASSVRARYIAVAALRWPEGWRKLLCDSSERGWGKGGGGMGWRETVDARCNTIAEGSGSGARVVSSSGLRR